MPFRFVVWSWCADQIEGQLEDVRVKARRADAEAWPLAWAVQQVRPDVSVSFMGYSYGARIATGALHHLAIVPSSEGGSLPPARVPLRAVLVAGALDNYWLRPGSRNGLAVSQVDRMLITVNPQDRVLKHYHLIYGLRDDRQALGATGAAGLGRLGEEREKVDHINVSRQVGSEHDWRRYLLSPLVGRMVPYALFVEPAGQRATEMATR
jgi:hypothetical protein